ncbi:glutamate 5-kinase [Niallia sp.]|uniref:glutamate 5-kinase n=1 Tax=Niallia sp. TaxID=2837523 RepID=UPI00289AD3DE|nr:glutamate 5-kinase [Niallia sp.]
MEKKRIVVKIGSSSLTDSKGAIDQSKLSDHIASIANLRNNGHEVLLVSSGAVAAGFAKLGYPTRPVTLKGKQAAAAVGQSLLIQSYNEQLSKYGIVPAQVLITRNDFSKRDRYRNAYNTLTELLERNILPIINENDTVSVEELTFGDNDMLSALVSGLIHADHLIILTDINGLYDKNPNEDPSAKRIDYLPEITDEWKDAAKGAGSKVGTGGMKSKLIAAETALTLGVKVFIGKGAGENKLIDIIEGEGDGTYIGSNALTSINSNRQWISLHSTVQGSLYVDEGAETALVNNGSSLLPAGIYNVEGIFEKGNVVEVYGKNGIIGKGEVLYSSEELKEIITNRVQEKRIEKHPKLEVIHRDKWVKM